MNVNEAALGVTIIGKAMHCYCNLRLAKCNWSHVVATCGKLVYRPEKGVPCANFYADNKLIGECRKLVQV